MRAPLSWWLVLVLSLAIAGYAFSFVLFGERMFPPPLAESFLARPWGIYPHAFFGTIALALGPFQFLRGTLIRRRWLHRLVGRTFMISAVLSGVAGLYMSYYSFGGWVTHLGFGSMAVTLLGCIAMAWLRIRRREVAAHREWVIRSFAVLFAAVTLRILLPVLDAGLGGFEPAYLWVSWLSWVPNLIVAEWYIRHTRGIHVPQPA
jgi:uncharacterized membrane protein